ncbi:MAG: polymer-forming cytoskeletal protein [Spirochaetaceae bacterium]|jgi:cytoskeletal protein CcmA (bactofilin family)|nr:polymer-forming cytoskeletal protein [Spirochaetaceae bacterium]
MAESKKDENVVVIDSSAEFEGSLKFKQTLCIQGKFSGTIDAEGSLIVDQGAVVEADTISVESLYVYGTVAGEIHALDQVDMHAGAEVKGDISAARLRIADGVLYEGNCNMTAVNEEIEIFSRPIEEIKAELH